MAAAVREGYADLFRTYPDANRKDNEALRNYFSAHTKVAESTLGLIVATFKKLSDLGDFEGVPVIEPAEPEEKETPARPFTTPGMKASANPPQANTPAININIQLQLPATDDADVYDKLFAALKKHLFSS